MRSLFVYLILMTVWAVSRVFYRHRLRWVSEPTRLWKDIRVIAVLNHTSLYEPLLAGFASPSLLWAFARHGVLPVAEKTMNRRIGLFFRFLVRHVVVVTRQRDHTWKQVLSKLDKKAVTIILPEGRMKRRNGLDSAGRPMTVRGGIADILRAIPEGRMLTVYSGGLHHIQAPGDLLPRMFKNIDAYMELIDIPEYCRELGVDGDNRAFNAAMIEDLTRRRDKYCPAPPSDPTPSPSRTSTAGQEPPRHQGAVGR